MRTVSSISLNSCKMSPPNIKIFDISNDMCWYLALAKSMYSIKNIINTVLKTPTNTLLLPDWRSLSEPWSRCTGLGLHQQKWGQGFYLRAPVRASYRRGHSALWWAWQLLWSQWRRLMGYQDGQQARCLLLGQCQTQCWLLLEAHLQKQCHSFVITNF